MFENDMFKTMIEFNRAAFNNGYHAVAAVQEKSEKMMSTFMDNNMFLPEEGKKALNQWVGLYKKGQKEYKKMMDDGFNNFEGFFKDQKSTATKKK